MAPLAAPKSLAEFQDMVVNRPGWEVVRQSLYDSAVYPALGTTQLTFFSLPVGQGVGFGGGTKTVSDTNMTNAGLLPTNQNFLLQAIEVYFQPTTPTVVEQMPAVFGAQAAAQIVNDAYIFRRAGNLRLFIGSKAYLEEAPLQKFPSSRQFHIEAALADQTTPGATMQSRIAFADAVGRPYFIEPNITLVENQNFSVTLNWPEGLQAITSPARVFVSLEGVLARRSQ